MDKKGESKEAVEIEVILEIKEYLEWLEMEIDISEYLQKIIEIEE